MTEYSIHVNGTVKNPDTGFQVGFDISVVNGGNLQDVGETLQNTFSTLEGKSVKKQVENPDNK